MVKIKRAWKNGLKNIDKLFIWLYDQNILSETDKKLKDKYFNMYYRFYNDGDKPDEENLDNLTVRKHGIEYALEEKIENFMKSMLKKYHGKYDRKYFHKDMRVHK